MNLHPRPRLSPRWLLPVLLFSLAPGLPMARAADEPEAAVDLSEQRQVLELDLARLYALIQQDTDPTTKTTLLGHQRELAGRANRLMEKFDPARYDELRYDINIQCQRLARKQAPLLVRPLGEKPETIPEIAVDELSPSPADKAEVQAALDVVDLTLRRLEHRLGRLTAGSVEYQAERDRIQRLKVRRAALGREFTPAGWDALAGELKPPGQ